MVTNNPEHKQICKSHTHRHNLNEWSILKVLYLHLWLTLYTEKKSLQCSPVTSLSHGDFLFPDSSYVGGVSPHRKDLGTILEAFWTKSQWQKIVMTGSLPQSQIVTSDHEYCTHWTVSWPDPFRKNCFRKGSGHETTDWSDHHLQAPAGPTFSSCSWFVSLFGFLPELVPPLDPLLGRVHFLDAVCSIATDGFMTECCSSHKTSATLWGKRGYIGIVETSCYSTLAGQHPHTWESDLAKLFLP